MNSNIQNRSHNCRTALAQEQYTKVPTLRQRYSVPRMIGMALQYCECPIYLLEQNHASQFMGQGHRA